MPVNNIAPKTMPELFDALKKLTPESKIISGGTDLTIKLNQGSHAPDTILYLGGIKEFKDITKSAECLEIGAMVTMTDLVNSDLIVGSYAAIKHAAADVGALQIRNSATVGGNLGNASPAGDLMPVWWLLNAEIIIAGADGNLRRAPVSEVFLGPGKLALSYNEAIVRFLLPSGRSKSEKSAFVKLGSRKTLTISRIGLAAMFDLDVESAISKFSLFVGAISPTPVSLKRAESYMLGKKPTLADAEPIGQFLSELIMEITPEHFDRDYKAAAACGVAEDLLKKLMQQNR